MTVGSFDGEQFRRAMGRFATGVCVVTASPLGYPPFGLTVNSFASLSLTPPLVLWSLRKASDTLEAFRAATHYCVNVLAHDQCELSTRLARRGDHELRPDEFAPGSTGLPVLHHTLAAFECKIEERYEGGDHIIMVGRALALHRQAGGRPLLFIDGTYRQCRCQE
jgi:flavin reductase (DIM6/NTAB) family NADH-FMN oxidoreductase RutF